MDASVLVWELLYSFRAFSVCNLLQQNPCITQKIKEIPGKNFLIQACDKNLNKNGENQPKQATFMLIERFSILYLTINHLGKV